MRPRRIKNQTKKHLVRAVREKLGPPGVLPDFLIIGVPRGGTTACFRQLTRHPQVGPPLEKELRFFDHRWQEGERFYRRCFPTAEQMSTQGWKVTGEATPRYLQHPDVPERVASLVPEARLVVLLRDPVLRAWSHYRLYVEKFGETRSFEQAIRDELDHPIDPREGRGRSYLSVGEYAPQLRRWFDRFPRGQFLVAFSEDYFADNALIQAKVQEHLGLDPFIPPVVRSNTSGEGGSGMNHVTEERLRRYFAPMIAETAGVLGVTPPWRIAG